MTSKQVEGFHGYYQNGFNVDGYTALGRNKHGINKFGFNINGYNAQGRNRQGRYVPPEKRGESIAQRTQRLQREQNAAEVASSSRPTAMIVNKIHHGKGAKGTGTQGKGAQGIGLGPYTGVSTLPPGVVLQESNRMDPDGNWYRQGHNGYWYSLTDGVSYYSDWPVAKGKGAQGKGAQGKGAQGKGAQGKGAQGIGLGHYARVSNTLPPGIVLQESNRMDPDGYWYRQGSNGYWHNLTDGGISYYSVWPDATGMSESRQSSGRGIGTRGSHSGSPDGGRANTRKLYGKGAKGKGVPTSRHSTSRGSPSGSPDGGRASAPQLYGKGKGMPSGKGKGKGSRGKGF